MTGLQRALCLTMLSAGLILSACSPEATRTRDGGPGADVGNHAPVVDLHGRQQPYYETPRYSPAASR